MPRRKKLIVEGEEEGVAVENPDSPEAENPVKKVCGHPNKHAVGMVQTCTLEPKHRGDHSAPYKMTLSNGEVVNVVAAWSDLAGTEREELVAAHDVEYARALAEKRAREKVM